MVNHVVNVIAIQSSVTRVRVAEYVRAFFYVLTYSWLHSLLSKAIKDKRSNVAVTLKQSHHGNLAKNAVARDSMPSVRVHVASDATDKRFINFDVARQLAALITLQGQAQ